MKKYVDNFMEKKLKAKTAPKLKSPVYDTEQYATDRKLYIGDKLVTGDLTWIIDSISKDNIKIKDKIMNFYDYFYKNNVGRSKSSVIKYFTGDVNLNDGDVIKTGIMV